MVKVHVCQNEVSESASDTFHYMVEAILDLRFGDSRGMRVTFFRVLSVLVKTCTLCRSVIKVLILRVTANMIYSERA